MGTINDLSVVTSLGTDDKLPIWSNANGVTRGLPISVLDARYLTQADIALLAASPTVETFTSGVDFTPGVTLALTVANQYLSTSNIEVFFDTAFQGPDQYTLVGTTLAFISAIPVGVQKVYVRGGATRLTGAPSDGTVTDVKVASGSKLYNRIYNHPEVADAGTVTTASFAAAVAAAQAAGGGTLRVANGVYSGVALPSAFSNVLLEYDGPKTAVNAYSDLGTPQTGQSYKTFRAADNTGHVGLENYCVFVDSHPFGSGDGTVPGSDFALGVAAIKQNWESTSAQGQVCGVNIVTRSGYTGAFVSPSYSPGDTTGIIVNTVQASTASYTSILEGFSAYYLNGNVTASDAVAMDVQLGPIRKDQNIAEGVSVSGSQGSLNRAFLAQNSGMATFASLLQYDAPTLGVTFDIPITGYVPRIRLFDGMGGAKSLRVSANSFSVLNAAETVAIFNVDNSGNAGVMGSMNTQGVYAVNNVQVVGGRVTGWAAPSGTVSRTSLNTGTATTAQIAQCVGALVDDLYTHGLIGN